MQRGAKRGMTGGYRGAYGGVTVPVGPGTVGSATAAAYGGASAYEYGGAYYGFGGNPAESAYGTGKYAGYGAGAYAGYGGGGYGGGYGGGGGAGGGQTHTSSKDPNAIKSRVFVGNLQTRDVSRETLEKLYIRFGKIQGVSIHKGYAFVQFGQVEEARNAVQYTDGMTICGQAVDVNIADEPKNATQKVASTGGGYGGPSLKRPRMEAEDETPVEYLMNYPGFPDTLKCGHCKQTYADLAEFRNHRKAPCTKAEAGSDENGQTANAGSGEPGTLYCFICKQVFAGSWILVQHLCDKHNMQVYTTE